MNKLFEKPSIEVNIKHFFKAGLNPNVNQISLNNELKVLTFKLLFGHNDFQLNFNDIDNISIKCKGKTLYIFKIFNIKDFFQTHYVKLLKYDISLVNEKNKEYNIHTVELLNNKSISIEFSKSNKSYLLTWTIPLKKTDICVFNMYTKNFYLDKFYLHLNSTKSFTTQNNLLIFNILIEMVKEIETPIQCNYILKKGEKLHLLLDSYNSF
jgi:hypothetical protein